MKGCMNCGNISCGNNKKRDCAGCGRWISPEDKIAELDAQIEKMQEKLKADLIARLEEQMQYSTSPSCTKGMELFIKSIEKWEIKEK